MKPEQVKLGIVVTADVPGNEYKIISLDDGDVIIRLTDERKSIFCVPFDRMLQNYTIVKQKIKKKIFFFQYSSMPGIFTSTDDHKRNLEAYRNEFQNNSSIKWVSDIKEIEIDEPSSSN